MLNWKPRLIYVLSAMAFCGLPFKVTAKTECQKQVEEAKSMIASGVVDIFVPVCRRDGHFAPEQCNLQGCFCVDETTGQRKDSDLDCAADET
ncbi:thyroglobulin-like [Oculina patagonica]